MFRLRLVLCRDNAGDHPLPLAKFHGLAGTQQFLQAPGVA
jgi:hypothetical protein